MFSNLNGIEHIVRKTINDLVVVVFFLSHSVLRLTQANTQWFNMQKKYKFFRLYCHIVSNIYVLLGCCTAVQLRNSNILPAHVSFDMCKNEKNDCYMALQSEASNLIILGAYVCLCVCTFKS